MPNLPVSPIVIEEVKTSSEFEPLINALNSGNRAAEEAFRHLVRARETYVQSKNPKEHRLVMQNAEPWLDLLHELSKNVLPTISDSLINLQRQLLREE